MFCNQSNPCMCTMQRKACTETPESMHSMTVQCALICRYLQKTFEKATTQIGDPIMEKGGIKKELHLTA